LKFIINKIEIEKSFERAKQIPRHPTDPTLKPVDIIPIVPDILLWGNHYSHIVFDSDPMLVEGDEDIKKDQETRMQYGLLRAFKKDVVHPNTNEPIIEKFVTYFVPKRKYETIASNEDDQSSQDSQEELEVDEKEDEEDTRLRFEKKAERRRNRKKRRLLVPAPDTDVEYDCIRNYHYEYKKDEKQYFFCFSEDSVSYLSFDHQIVLQSIKTKQATPDQIVVRHEEMSESLEKEFELQAARLL